MDLGYRLTDSMSEATTNVCRAGVARYNSVGATHPNKNWYVPNGVNLRAFDRVDVPRSSVRKELGFGDGFLWLAVGRLVREKDYPTMLQAVALAATDSQLLIVGDGEEGPELKAMVAKLGLENRTRFLGYRSDINNLMGAADSFLMSSVWEGLPMVLLEAGASGLPVVATDVGGVADIVRPGAGIIVGPGDVTGLAHAIREVEAKTAEERREMGTLNRQNVHDSFDIERVVDTWERLYSYGLQVAKGTTSRRAFPFDYNDVQALTVGVG